MLRYLIFCCYFVLLTGCNKGTAVQTTEFELDNGLTVVLQPLPMAKTNALIVLYDIGNRFDPPGRSGMAHLAEHLCVTAATENTPARNVDEYVAAYPDGWNAQTGDDYTVFANTFKPDRLNDELRDAADRMRAIKPDQADLDRELPRIEKELNNMYERIPSLAVSNHGRDRISPLSAEGRRGGKIEELKTVDVKAIGKWLDQYYKPGNATLVLCGVFDEEVARGEIIDLFGKIEKGEMPVANELPSAALNSGIFEVTVRPWQANVPAQVGFTFRAPDWDDPHYPAFVVHATRMMIASQQQMRKGSGPVFMWRTLDDPQFCYASVEVNDGESTGEAIGRLEEWLDSQTAAALQPTHLRQTENMLGMFLGLAELPPAMLAVNSYGAAFSKGRRVQMGIDVQKLKSAFAKIDQAAMTDAAAKYLASSIRATISVLPANERP